jgi:atypical dual specificity phosphatase
MMLRLLIHAAFYPSLWFNRLMCALGLWHQADWVDEHVAIGSLPSRADLARLRAEGVTAVVNHCEEFAGDAATLGELGLEQLHLPTMDYHCPAEDDLRRGLVFMDDRIAAGGKVLAHCKAGRGRSAILVLCYLMMRNRIDANSALVVLKRARPGVASGIERHLAVRSIERSALAETVNGAGQ